MIHDLKTWPDEFSAVIDGSKSHEIRCYDRPFRVGDTLHLREWIPAKRSYTRRAVDVEVTHMTPAGAWGLPTDLCVMSIRVRS